MKTSVVAQMGSLAMAFIGLSAQAVTYVKPDGTGKGVSWADAASLETAIASGGDIYLAKGVYYPAATLQLADGTRLYGGYSGEGEARDVKENETIICGDTGKNDVWTLVHPATGTEEKTSVPIIKDGKINFPDFDDAYETCYNSLNRYSGNVWPLVSVSSSAAVTVDGIIFACGGGRDTSGIYADNATVTVTNCRFVACTSTLGIIRLDTSAVGTVTSCSFEFCRNGGDGTINAYWNYKSLAISDCDFIGNSSSGTILHKQSKMSVSNCRFTRNFVNNTAGTRNAVCLRSSGNDGGAKGTASVSDCTMIGNSAYDTTGNPVPMVMVFPSYDSLRNVTIASNRVVVVTEATTVLASSAVHSEHKFNNLGGFSVFDNELVVTAPNATQVDAAPVTLVDVTAGGELQNGNNKQLTVYSSTFADNGVTVTAADGATVNVARGVLYRIGEDPQGHCELSVYNCTFAGETAGPDILFGGTSAAGGGCVAYNNVFWATGASATTPRVVNVGVAPFKLGYSTIVDPTLLADNIDTAELRSDDPLLEKMAILTAGKCPVMRLGAAVPGVRTTADVTHASYYDAPTFQYRLPGSSTWVQPSGYYYGALTPNYIASALGEARTAGGFTEGAVQALAPLAETGRTVVIRPEPTGVGRIEGGNTHVMAADAASYEVTAVSTNGAYAFHSWRTTDGEIVSTANPYVLNAPGQGTTVLVARFNPSKVAYTFDLGEHGTFDVCGLAVTNVIFAPDAPVVVPAYTTESGYTLRRWTPELPASAGGEDASFAAVYVAQVTVVPTDGDLADALAAAAVYAGEAEVRLASGTHTLAASVSVPKNVTLTGEDGAVLTGATSVGYALDGTSDADETAPCRVSNVTFSVIGARPGYHVATFEDCVFTNVTSAGWAALVAYTNITVKGCVFANNRPAFIAPSKGSGYNIYDCTFTNCSFVANQNGTDYIAWNGAPWSRKGVVVFGNVAGRMTDCHFKANTNSLQGCEMGILYAGGQGGLYAQRCRFEANVAQDALDLIYMGYYTSGQYIDNSLLLCNRVIGDRGKDSTGTASLIARCVGDKAMLNGNSFVSNVVDRTEAVTSSKTTTSMALLLDGAGNLPGFMNCYFEGNRVAVATTAGTTTPLAHFFNVSSLPQTFGVCNSTFYNNVAADGIIRFSASGQQAANINNCIFRNGAGTPDFCIVGESATAMLRLNGCVAANLPEYGNLATYLCEDAGLRFGKLQMRDGRLVRHVAPLSTLRQLAVPVYTDKNGVWAKVNGTYTKGAGMWGSGMNHVGPDVPLADMFGGYDGQNICGAYRRIPSLEGLVIFVR